MFHRRMYAPALPSRIVGGLVLLVLSLVTAARPATASCWKDAPLCDTISFYGITYNGGQCGGSYDIAFTAKYGFFPGVCGTGGSDLWSVSDGGTGYDTEINVVRVFPYDPNCSRSNPFIAYIKVKAYDAQSNPKKTGAGPSPYFIDPTQFVNPGDTIRVVCP